MDILEQRNHHFHKWMRQKGLKLWFALLFFCTWIFWSTQLTEPRQWSRPILKGGLENLLSDTVAIIGWILDNVAQNLGLYQWTWANLERYGFAATFFMSSFRLFCVSLIPIILDQFYNIIFKVAPEPDRGGDEDNWNGITDKSSDSGFLYRNGYTKPTHIHCMCIRLLTRGDAAAQPLARKSVTVAVKLFSKMCTYDHLKVHVVTQTKFLDKDFLNNLRKWGATEAKELYVPPDYATPKGTLFKARNICFWQDMGGVGQECDPSKSWILSLDEEAVISRQLVTSFLWDVLNSPDEPRIGYAMGPALMDVNYGPVSFMVKVMEALWITNHYTYINSKGDTLQNTPCFHGGAFFARASCDRIVGNDCGPAASVAEDYTVGLAITDNQIGVKQLKGWFTEGTKPNLWTYLVHHARCVRGQLYATYNMQVSRGQLIGQVIRFALAVLVPFYHTCHIISIVTSPSTFFPSATQCTFLDVIVAFTFTTQFCCYAFGAIYLDLKVKETIGVMLMGILMVLVFNGMLETIGNLIIMGFIVKDWIRGSFTFEVTSEHYAKGGGPKKGKKD